MKKTTAIFTAIVAFVALQSFAEGEQATTNRTGNMVAWLGFASGFNSNSSASTYIGPVSGANSTNSNHSTFVGSMAGAITHNVEYCDGIGHCALVASRGNTNVVAIGRHAGRGSVNCRNCVFIGNSAGDKTTNAVDRTEINGQLTIDGTADSLQLHASKTEAPVLDFTNGTLTLRGCPNLRWENGQLAVYINGQKIGTLTLTAPQE